MKVYVLGKVGDMLSTTLFHAMAKLGYAGLVLCEPEDSYISLGYFDDAKQIINFERCKELGLGIIRREIGGGTVLLAPGQVFYQLILPKSLVPFRVEDAYRKLSLPVIKTYRRLGLEVEYKPINDLVVAKSQRKISGQGAGDIGKFFVFVGNILVRFDPDLMVEVLRLDEEKKRLVRESMRENISWLERELNKSFSFQEVASLLTEEFSKELPFSGFSEVPAEALSLAQRLKEEMTSLRVLTEDTGRVHSYLKIREGIYVKL